MNLFANRPRHHLVREGGLLTIRGRGRLGGVHEGTPGGKGRLRRCWAHVVVERAIILGRGGTELEHVRLDTCLLDRARSGRGTTMEGGRLGGPTSDGGWHVVVVQTDRADVGWPRRRGLGAERRDFGRTRTDDQGATGIDPGEWGEFLASLDRAEHAFEVKGRQMTLMTTTAAFERIEPSDGRSFDVEGEGGRRTEGGGGGGGADDGVVALRDGRVDADGELGEIVGEGASEPGRGRAGGGVGRGRYS